MAGRTTPGRLKPLDVARASRPGLYGDGGGLYLQVKGDGGRSWLYRYKLAGRARAMGLGGLDTVSLREARQLAAECRKQCHAGVDPIEARRANRNSGPKAMTFSECAERYLAAHKAGWRNEKHATQWKATLDAYVAPVFGETAVAAVDTALVMQALDPIWTTKPETASRVRGRIEAVLDWARVRGYRSGENPARWRGHLAALLPAKSRVRTVRHHPALAYAQVPAFMAELGEQEGVAALALRFTILTAARTNEATGATWSELDLAEAVWTVPAKRIKAGKEHRVPLSDGALQVVEQMRAVRSSDFVFPGGREGRPLSNNAMLALLERMGLGAFTVHGFRSSFRDWAAEQTNFPSEVVEAALAHAIGDKVEAAYRRGDLFEKRRALMAAWAGYCAGEAKVIRLRREKA